jgi:dTDP-glucose 4,6-dehydratase
MKKWEEEVKNKMTKKVLLTGIAGFVGHHFLEHILKTTDWDVIGLARMNTVGDLNRFTEIDCLKDSSNAKRVRFVYHDLKYAINDSVAEKIGKVDYIIHLAANSHVDRSITHPKEFFEDNVMGTVNLLEHVRLNNPEAKMINFGTDEVFGPAPADYNFKEDDRYRPSNPYSAAKAGQMCAGHSYYVTYGLNIISTYTMNIFGERQNPEKLMPKAMRLIMAGEPVPIHAKLDAAGNAEFVGQRHWLHARNAADAILFLLDYGEIGEHYNVVGDAEYDNDEFVAKIGDVLGIIPKFDYVDFHKARPGHDRRYALDGSKIAELGWTAPMTFEDSLKRTVNWTLKNEGK